MPETLEPTTSTISDAEHLDALHASVVTCDEPDHDYNNPISNKQKVEYICRHGKLKPQTFDLTGAFPFEIWLKSQDTRLVTVGLFLTDLQEEFFEKWMNGAEKDAPHKVWEAHADAENWHLAFRAENVFLHAGAEIIDERTLN